MQGPRLPQLITCSHNHHRPLPHTIVCHQVTFNLAHLKRFGPTMYVYHKTMSGLTYCYLICLNQRFTNRLLVIGIHHMEQILCLNACQDWSKVRFTNDAIRAQWPGLIAIMASSPPLTTHHFTVLDIHLPQLQSVGVLLDGGHAPSSLSVSAIQQYELYYVVCIRIQPYVLYYVDRIRIQQYVSHIYENNPLDLTVTTIERIPNHSQVDLCWSVNELYPQAWTSPWPVHLFPAVWGHHSSCPFYSIKVGLCRSVNESYPQTRTNLCLSLQKMKLLRLSWGWDHYHANCSTNWNELNSCWQGVCQANRRQRERESGASKTAQIFYTCCWVFLIPDSTVAFTSWSRIALHLLLLAPR